MVNLISIINSDLKADKFSKLVGIVSQLCHEKIENRFRIKTINDLLKKQGLRSSAFVMYVDIYFDAEKNLVMLDYPFYPKIFK